jgi:AcrR family transcriptional regulator
MRRRAAPRDTNEGITVGRTNPGAAATARPSGRRGARLPQAELQRRLLIAAITALAHQRDWQGLPVERLCARAGVSRRTFYELFADVDDCFASAVEDALAKLWEEVAAWIEPAGPGWADRVAAAIAGFLAAVDLDRPRAWMAVVEPLHGNPRAYAARAVVVERLVALLEQGPVDADADRSPASTAAGTIGGLWEHALQHVTGAEGAADLDVVAGSVTFLALSPFAGRQEAMRHASGGVKPSRLVAAVRADELAEAEAADEPATLEHQQVAAALLRLTELGIATLRHLGERPGGGNAEIAAAVGVTHESQISRHLRSLAAQGLVDGRRGGRSNSWRLTALGDAVVERAGEERER